LYFIFRNCISFRVCKGYWSLGVGCREHARRDSVCALFLFNVGFVLLVLVLTLDDQKEQSAASADIELLRGDSEMSLDKFRFFQKNC
jgi:hypothetical protein